MTRQDYVNQWYKAASFLDRAGEFAKQNPHVIGGLLGATAGALVPSESEDEYDIVTDEYGRRIKKPKTSVIGKLTNAAIGGALGAGLGYGYKALNGDTAEEKLNGLLPKSNQLSYIPRYANGKLLTETERFNTNVAGTTISGGGQMTQSKMDDYMSPSYYLQKLQESASSPEGSSRMAPIVQKMKEQLMASGYDPEAPGMDKAINQAALSEYNKWFSGQYTSALERNYGYNPGELSTYGLSN